MATERKNTALEFETMLRRHLKSGGAPVTACAGFDFDAASAYLEEALGGSQRTGYESHLAGCAVCRRHLIELSRLAQTVPHAGTKPAPVLDQNPAWVRWREVVAGWFDLSTWNLKWQMLGAAGVAFAILIAALGVQSWRQASKADNLAVASTADAPTASTEPAQMLQMPTPDPSPQGEQDSSTAESATVHPDRSRASLPAPPVRPQAGDLPDAPVEPSKELLTLNTFQPGAPPSLDSNLRRIQAPAGDRQNAVAALQNLAPQQGGAALLDSSDNADKPALAMANPGGSGRVSRELAANSAAQAESNKIRNDITARITPPPGTNPMNSEPKPT
ncbi:MAG: hypothetical protein ACREAB_13070, partial [Blastocatellia bacterium]